MPDYIWVIAVVFAVLYLLLLLACAAGAGRGRALHHAMVAHDAVPASPDSAYYLIPAGLVETLRASLPAPLAYELDTGLHTTGALPADVIRDDPGDEYRLRLLLDPGNPLGVVRLRSLAVWAAGVQPEVTTAEFEATWDAVRADPVQAVSNLILYADAGAPPPLVTVPPRS